MTRIAPGLRGRADENYPGRPGDAAGRLGGVSRLRPATLAVFRGQHALLRVTPSAVPPPINSVLTYGEHTDMKLDELTRKLFYRRTA
jgi:hypothetical protein